MDIKRNLSNSLRALCEARSLTLQEFAEEINIPRTTLQSIFAEGNTTLETLMRISEGTGLPPEMLLQDDAAPRKIGVARWLLQGVACYDELTEFQQQKLADYIDGIMEVVGNDGVSAGVAADRAYF